MARASACWTSYYNRVGDLSGPVPDANLTPALSASKRARLSDCLLLRSGVGGGAAMAFLHDLPTTIALAWLYVSLANHLDILLRTWISTRVE
jgi:hypothetical protein